jgi:hypothetical protein
MAGHTFDDIDNLNLQDYFDIIAVWAGEGKVQDKGRKRGQDQVTNKNNPRSSGRKPRRGRRR